MIKIFKILVIGLRILRLYNYKNLNAVLILKRVADIFVISTNSVATLKMLVGYGSFDTRPNDRPPQRF